MIGRGAGGEAGGSWAMTNALARLQRPAGPTQRGACHGGPQAGAGTGPGRPAWAAEVPQVARREASRGPSGALAVQTGLS